MSWYEESLFVNAENSSINIFTPVCLLTGPVNGGVAAAQKPTLSLNKGQSWPLIVTILMEALWLPAISRGSENQLSLRRGKQKFGNDSYQPFFLLLI